MKSAIKAIKAQPLIVLTAYAEPISWGVWRDVPAALLPMSYIERVAAAGGATVLLPPVPEAVETVIASADGLLLSGGPDIDPAHYGEPRDPATQAVRPARDACELAALAAAAQRGIPVLAICRGMQLLAVARGGSLYQHLPGHAPTNPGHYDTHTMTIDLSSRLGGALGGSATVRCHHHQGVARLGAGLVATAWAEDGTCEGIEDPSAPFVVGVQSHPEEDGHTAALFAAFAAAAGNCRWR
ncbi:MAG: gamma-glutamyl-gamma-aminobutyrate hydrolase family protein [Pseudonocardia sp.]|nr:gamma-glutamyl-gamma-aminobutyrate hydrolase family protein [Pseudonocardia sp.]